MESIRSIYIFYFTQIIGRRFTSHWRQNDEMKKRKWNRNENSSMLTAHKFKLIAKNERKTKTKKPNQGGVEVYLWEKMVFLYKFNWGPCKDRIQSLNHLNEHRKYSGRKDETNVVIHTLHKANTLTLYQVEFEHLPIR